MRFIFIVLVTIGSLLLTKPAAAGIPVFFSFGGEVVSEVMQLPHAEGNKVDGGKYLDLGVIYKQFTLFFIPVFNYDIRYCGYIGSDSKYYDIDNNGMKEFISSYGMKMPEEPPMPFWDAYGGKLLLAFLVYSFFLIIAIKQKGTLNKDGKLIPELQSALDEKNLELAKCREKGKLAIQQRDEALEQLSRHTSSASNPRDLKFLEAKKAFARLYHPDNVHSNGIDKMVRTEIFKEYWKELDQIEKKQL